MAQDRHPQFRPAPGFRRRRSLHPLLVALLVGGVLAVLFMVGALVQRRGIEEPAAGTVVGEPARATPAEPSSSPPPGIGDPVRDGKFEFVISRLDCSRTSIGLEHLKRTARGKFCVVSLSVRNIADAAQYFLGHAQEAFDTAGIGYHNDEIAGVYVNRDNQTFLRKLDPGERVAGKLVFDVPKPVRLATLELHDSPLSGGVTITLR